MIYYNKHSIDNSDIKAVNKVLNSNYLTQGPLNSKFEKKLCDYFGSKYCNVLSNGTTALYLGLLSLELNKREIILISPLSFVAGAMSAAFLNHKVDFVDINNDTYSPCEVLLEKKILELKKRNKKVGCIIITDYSGIPANWKEINRLKNKYRFKIINDNCHAIGSTYLNSYKYAVEYADLVVQSYHAIKNITTCEGGSILTNSKILNRKITLLKSHGITRNLFEKKKFGAWFYDVKTLGLNFRLSEVQCALGINQLSKLNVSIRKRFKIVKIYDNVFKSLKFIKTPNKYSDRKSSFHIYPILIDFSKLKISKKKLFEILKKKGYSLQVNYIPTYKFTFFKKNFNKDDFPNTEDFYYKEISRPCYYDLPLKEVYKFSTILKKILLNYEK